ncbi:hypothetical protein, partial [Roseinatronobacter alkalisoli]
DRFSIAIGELEYDDQFMAILSYDGRFPQPWSRVDVDREIADIGYLRLTEYNDPMPVALSNEGDVYTMLPGGTDWSKIPGTGILSEDADGRGDVYNFLIDGTRCFVLGRSGQLYQRDKLGEWETLSLERTSEPGYRPEAFGYVTVAADGSVVISSSQQPASPTGRLTHDPRFRADMSATELGALMAQRRHEAAGGSHITRLYRFDGRSFSRLDIPEDLHIRNIHTDPMGRIWIVGVDGLILRGRPEDGFGRLDFHGDTETLHSATWFQGELIVASGYMLHRFDGHRLTPLKPKLNDPFRNRNTPTPMKLQTVGDVMFYFDYKHGVCRWDGESWDWIDIPPALLERDFKGFPTP